MRKVLSFLLGLLVASCTFGQQAHERSAYIVNTVTTSASGTTAVTGSVYIAGVPWAMNVAMGNVSGYSVVHKFGEAPDIDTADAFADVWDGAGDTIGAANSTYTFSTTNDIDSIASSDGSDGQVVEVQGLDSGWVLTVQNATLNGQTRVALGTPLRRVFRMKNLGATDFAGNVYCYVTNGPTSSGVPDVATDIRAVVQSTNNQTLMAIYTIPDGKTGYFLKWWATNSQKKDQISDILVKVRPEGGVFQLKEKAAIQATGSSHIDRPYPIPLGGIAEHSDVKIQSDTSKDNGATAAGFDILLVDD